MKLKKFKWSVLVFALSLAAAGPLFAQNGPPGGGGGGPGGDPNGGPGGGGPGGGGPGGPGGFGGGPPSPAEHRQRELEHVQDEMELSDDKWQALQPKLEKLMEMEDDLHPQHGPPRPDDQREENQSAVSKALSDLREILDDRDAKADAIQAKVDAYEKAKAKATDDVKKAQDDLRADLAPIQVAILIAHQILD